MKVDAQLRFGTTEEISASAANYELQGYHGIWTAETDHDPFLPLALAAASTSRTQLGTAIAVAFARNPMTLAYSAHDLQLLSGGRLLLGVGSQVKAHIERRFAMPWGQPADRMRDYLLALGAIWASWNNATPLNYDGPFYRHNLMTPMFSPPPSPSGPPKVHLAAVGDRMISVAGEVADGLILHPFNSARSVRENALEALQNSLSANNRQRSDVEVSLPLLVVMGTDDDATRAADRAVRQQIAFYASTPSYRWILDLHGWSATGERLTELSRSGDADRWANMAQLIDDEMLDCFAVVGTPTSLPAIIQARYGGLVDRLSFYLPYPVEAGLVTELLRQVRHVASSSATPHSEGQPA